MPEITLRRAAQIVNSLKAPGDGATTRRRNRVMLNLDLTPMRQFDIDTASADRAEASRAEFFTRFGTAMSLIDIENRLRVAINNANVRSGVSAFVTDRVAKLRAKSILEALIQQIENDLFNADDFVKELGGRRERIAKAENIGYGDQTKFNAVVLTADDLAAFKEKLIAVNRQLVDIDDQLVVLNSGTKIDISSDDWRDLRQLGIV